MYLSDLQKQFVRKVVLDRSGQVLSQDQDYMLQSRLESLARRKNYESPVAMLERAMKTGDQALLQAMAEEFTVNETRFFRDAAMFQMLHDEVFPALIERRSQQKRLSIWSAASSSGQEAYSLAMMLHELLNNPSSWNIRILGTDISREMLQRVKLGVYDQFESQRGLSEERRSRYFSQTKEGWQVNSDLRRMISTQHYNLARPTSTIAPQDCILLRNVLIYFSDELKSKIVSNIAASLARDGYLILGAGENLSRLTVPVKPELIAGQYVYRRSDRND